MGRLTDRELNRLSFLMASLVASPELSPRLIQRVLQGEDPTQGSFQDVVNAIALRVAAASTQAPPTQTTLRDVAGDLIANEDNRLVTAGRLLAAALESARVAL